MHFCGEIWEEPIKPSCVLAKSKVQCLDPNNVPISIILKPVCTHRRFSEKASHVSDLNVFAPQEMHNDTITTFVGKFFECNFANSTQVSNAFISNFKKLLNIYCCRVIKVSSTEGFLLIQFRITFCFNLLLQPK